MARDRETSPREMVRDAWRGAIGADDAAKRLGVSTSTLYDWMRRLDLTPDEMAPLLDEVEV